MGRKNRLTGMNCNKSGKINNRFGRLMLFIFLTFIGIGKANAQFKFNIEGIVRENDKGLGGVLITLSNDESDQTKQATTNASGSFSFSLKPNQEYTLTASKEGYVKVKLLYSTIGFSDEEIKDFKGSSKPEFELFKLPADQALADQIDEAFEKPLMSFFYSSGKAGLSPDEDLNESMQQEFLKYQKIADDKNTGGALAESKYKAALAKGDKGLAAKNYDQAKAGYNEALILKPAEQYPKTKLAEVDKAIVDAADKDKLASEKAKADAAEKDRLAKEKAIADAAEKERLAKEKANAAEKERLAKAAAAADAAEKERIAKEKAAADAAEKERLAKVKTDADAAEKARIAKEKADAAEKDRLAKAAAATDAAEKDRIAKEKAAADAAEKERLAKAKADADASALAEKQKIAAAEKAEKDRITKEKADADAAALAEKQKQAAAEVAKKDSIAKSTAAAAAAELAEKQRIAAAEKAEKDRIAKEKADAEAAEKEKIAKEKAVADAAEKARIEKEKEKEAKEKAIADAAEKARLDKEKIEKALEDRYTTYINRGDSAISEQDYDAAKVAFNEALKVKENEAYPKKRIAETATLKAKDEAEKNDLAKKYPKGVTEEIVNEKNTKVTRRIVVIGNKGYLYTKNETSFGTVFYFKDGVAITEKDFNRDTVIKK